MGNVRLGADLIKQIKENATKPFTDTINTELQRLGNDPKLIRMIRLKYAGGNTALVDAVEQLEIQNNASGWLSHYQAPIANIPGNHNIRFEGTINGQHSFSWGYLPVEAQQYIQSNRKLIDRADTDRKSVIELIDKIAESCTTLKQAEQVLPSILEWLPQETLSKHRAPNTKAKPKLDIAAVRAGVLDQDKISAINRARIK